MNACPLKTLNQCVALTFIKTGHVAACTQYKDQKILTVWDIYIIKHSWRKKYLKTLNQKLMTIRFVPKVPKKVQDYATLPQCHISDETAQRLTDRLLAFPKKFWPRQSIYYLFKNGIIINNNSKRGIMHPTFEASDLEMAMNCLHLSDLSDEELNILSMPYRK